MRTFYWCNFRQYCRCHARSSAGTCQQDCAHYKITSLLLDIIETKYQRIAPHRIVFLNDIDANLMYDSTVHNIVGCQLKLYNSSFSSVAFRPIQPHGRCSCILSVETLNGVAWNRFIYCAKMSDSRTREQLMGLLYSASTTVGTSDPETRIIMYECTYM